MNLFAYNSKLRTDSIYKWSLPALTTCPGAGSCRGYCYMKRVYSLRGLVAINRHKLNYALSKKRWFVDMAVAELQSRLYIKYLRIHDSGDFYSQSYLNKWAGIAERCPGVFFYSYTKSLNLDFKWFGSLPNVKVIQSEGGKYRIDRRKPHAVVISSVDRVPGGYMNASRSDRIAISFNKLALYRRG